MFFGEKLGFSQTIADQLQLSDERTFCIYENNKLLQQKIYQLIARYHEDDAAGHLTTDPVFTQIPDKPALASQLSLSSFFIDLIWKRSIAFKRRIRRY
ncbi:hypothetical protein CSV80_15155 [Sporosarcina sp. P12(2017)]|nr:hypothetical protein CSV81_16000 [Sporosarcina sp. P10]PIC59610.1 hypothetical protein CSV80_15155 [Sporosarcina sp. P12(2017)]